MDNVSFKNKQVVIVCHDSMAGPPHHTLRDYALLHKAQRVVFIGHQNRYVQNNPVKASYLEVYENGKLILKKNARQGSLPEGLAYIRDFFKTFVWIFRHTKGKIHYFIGLGNLNALNGLILQTAGKTEKVVYYVIDYMPVRFPSVIMNTIYHCIDYICARFCTATWNYAEGMIKARNKKWKRTFPNQAVVPNGIFIRKENVVTFEKIHKHELIYLGTLYEQQGVMLLIDALSLIDKEISDVSLTIIGIGPLRKELEQQLVKNDMRNRVTFTGFIEDPIIVERIVSKAALGVAMYRPDIGFVGFTEPGKVKRYLSCSVPVIMTDVSPLAKDVVRTGCGLCSPYDVEKFATMVSSFLGNPEKMKKYRKKAFEYVKDYEWEKIFTDAFHFTKT